MLARAMAQHARGDASQYAAYKGVASEVSKRLRRELRLPRNRVDRLSIREEVMLLRDCCYWHYIEPNDKIQNVRSKRIRIPRINQFTPEALAQLMKRLQNGEKP